MSSNTKTNTFTSSPASSPPPRHTRSLQCPAAAPNIASPRTPLTFLLSIRRKLCLPIYTTQTGPLAPVDIMNMPSTETAPSAVNKVAKNKHITSLLWILPELYLLFLHKPATFFPTHPWQSNNCSTSAQTRQHDLSAFHSLPIPQHATIAHTPLLGQTSTSPGPCLPPNTYQPDAEDILNTITANAENNLQHHVRGKLGRMHKPSTPNTPFIHGDEVIGELYRKNMVLFPFTFDPWARFGPMLHAFLTTTHHPCQKPWRTTHTNYKYHRPNANLIYERASQPPCPLGILISADIRWTQSASPTRRTFFGNSYTAPTSSLYSTLQLIGLSLSNAYNSSLL